MRHDLLMPASLALTVGFGGVVIAGVAAGLAAGLAGACSRILARRQHLVAGDPAPDLEARDQDGARVALSGYRGHPLVVYFYPKDRTSGCTLEAQAFRADYPQFKEVGAEILGVSNDDVASHRDFCTKEGLSFPLLADPDQAIARAFGVKSMLGLYQRITFVIDGQGVVRQVFESVRPAGHAREVLAAVKALAVAGRPPPSLR